MREIESLDELYRDIVLDHYRTPRNSEPLGEPDAEGEADVNNPDTSTKKEDLRRDVLIKIKKMH